jgi:hypothetical protein
MSYVSTFTEVVEIDSRILSGAMTMPLTSEIPGRVITIKDIYGSSLNSTIKKRYTP